MLNSAILSDVGNGEMLREGKLIVFLQGTGNLSAPAPAFCLFLGRSVSLLPLGV
jgi:hypothetical protein